MRPRLQLLGFFWLKICTIAAIHQRIRPMDQACLMSLCQMFPKSILNRKCQGCFNMLDHYNNDIKDMNYNHIKKQVPSPP